MKKQTAEISNSRKRASIKALQRILNTKSKRKISNEEKYFIWFLDELIMNGYLLDYYYEPEPFKVAPSVLFKVNNSNITAKDKKSKQYNIKMKSQIYTCDFKLIWSKSANNVFYFLNTNNCLTNYHFIAYEETIDNVVRHVTYIEVKPDSYDFQNMNQVANKNKALVYIIHNKIIEIIKPRELFNSLFYPKRYLKTDDNKLRRRYQKAYVDTYAVLLDDYVTTNNEYVKNQISILTDDNELHNDELLNIIEAIENEEGELIIDYVIGKDNDIKLLSAKDTEIQSKTK